MEAGNLALKYDQKYTYTNYASWNDDTRWELIDGVPYAMSAPSLVHQEVLLNLSAQFSIKLRGRLCRPFIAPVDVRLNFNKGDDTVVQPDMIVVCDQHKLVNGKSCLGAPDLVVEVISPASTKMDKLLKFKKYLHAGVKEYWILDPIANIVEAYILKNGEYVVNSYSAADTITVSAFADCEITLADVFIPEEPQETQEADHA